jgi:PAS domain S-box-containing protein
MLGRNYRDLAIWVVAVAAIIGNAAVSHFNIDRMVRLERATLRTRSVQLELNQLLSDIKDAETGHRGYLLSEDEDFLKPFLDAERGIESQLARTRDMVDEDRDQLEEFAGLEALCRQRFAEMKRVQTLYRTEGLPAARRLIAEREGKRLMDEIRRKVAIMQEFEDRKLRARTTSADQNIYLARLTSFIGAGIAVAVILLASSLVQRELDRRLKANLELKESEGRFRNLAEAMPQIVWMTRPDGYHEYYNRRWYEYTGMTPEQSIGWGWSDPLHRDDRERSQIRWQRSTDAGESYEIKYRFRRHDGEYRWFLGRAEPVRDEAGNVVRWLGTCTDIDEQVNATQRLQESEAYLRSVLDNSPDSVMILDTYGNLLDMNGPGLAAVEVDDFQTVRGSDWAGTWPEAVRPSVARAVAAAAGGEVSRFSGPCPTAKGAVKYWDVIVAPIPDAHGKPFRLIGVSRDVTDQQTAQRALRESQRYIESVLHSLPSHLAVLEANGDIVTVNEAWRRFGVENGLPEDHAWAGKNYFESSRNDKYGVRAIAGIKAVAAGETDFFQMEYPCHAKDRERYFNLRVTRFRGDGPLRLVVTHENITDRRIAERQLQESASRLRQLAEGLPQLIWSCTADGTCDYLSVQWGRYTGRPVEEQLGYAWLNVVHADDRDRVAEAWGRAVSTGAVYDVEFRIRRHDAAYRWFAVRGIPVYNDHQRIVHWYGSCTDIDDQKRQAEVLERLVAERTAALTAAYDDLQGTSALLKASNDELEKFAYIASHDLQEPLRKIQAFGDRLSKKYRAQIDDTGRDYIDRMLDSAGRMRRLIEDLLQFSRVTTKTQAFEAVRLNEVLENVQEDLQNQIERTGGRVEVGPLPTLTADAVQLQQLFQNLVGNALKFGKPGVPPVVTVAAAETDAGWRITVADNGIGFEQQYADKIFELFQRLHGRTQFEGTGLGLAICKKIVLRHGATIVATSTPGEGATFIIDWPTRRD